jgi:hypothetical protein
MQMEGEPLAELNDSSHGSPSVGALPAERPW